MKCKLLCAAVVASTFALSGGTEADDGIDTASQTSVLQTGQEKSPRQWREVIVVKGKYHLAQTSGRGEIRLYGRILTERTGGGGSGSFERFVPLR